MVKENQINNIINQFNLDDRTKIIDFINFNPLNLGVTELSKLAEKVNNKRTDTAAYYTDKNILEEVFDYLPNFDKDEILILEPSVGVGNFIPIILKKYKDLHSKIYIDVVDIDPESIQIFRELLNKMDVPRNVEINFFVKDYLNEFHSKKYDLVIGNPPFLKLNKEIKENLPPDLKNNNIRNLSGLFLYKSINTSSYVVMILPKYMLSNDDFKEVRELASTYKIDKIIDFGEKGFRGVKIETLCIFIDKDREKGLTEIKNITKGIIINQNQDYFTDSSFPNWLIYRNKKFDEQTSKLILGEFNVFRDRQITNKLLSKDGDIRVIKSRNISRDGQSIINIENYDAYISKEEAKDLYVKKFLDDDSVYLSPNMTYYPRVIKKPKNTLVNGSVAILINKKGRKLTNKELTFLSSTQFQEYYSIARNYSTRSLNIDNTFVYYFGILR